MVYVIVEVEIRYDMLFESWRNRRVGEVIEFEFSV